VTHLGEPQAVVQDGPVEDVHNQPNEFCLAQVVDALLIVRHVHLGMVMSNALRVKNVTPGKYSG
jgi:hypothetical protein